MIFSSDFDILFIREIGRNEFASFDGLSFYDIIMILKTFQGCGKITRFNVALNKLNTLFGIFITENRSIVNQL